MKPSHPHKTQKSQPGKNAAHLAQEGNLSAFELDEETLDQVTGGQSMPTDTSRWKTVHTFRSIAPGKSMKVSPDGKYYTIGDTVLPNRTLQLD